VTARLMLSCRSGVKLNLASGLAFFDAKWHDEVIDAILDEGTLIAMILSWEKPS